MYFVYILSCNDGSFYIGWTQDVEERVKVHQSGRGAAFTAARLPVTLVYHESCARLEDAVRRERQPKGWSRAKKEALIAGNLQRLHDLSRSRSTNAG